MQVASSVKVHGEKFGSQGKHQADVSVEFNCVDNTVFLYVQKTDGSGHKMHVAMSREEFFKAMEGLS